MNLNLIHDWFDFAAGEQIDHHWDCAVADGDALGKPLLHQLLHSLPDDVEGRRGHVPILTFKVDWQDHPMDHIAVNVFELKLSE